VLFLLLLQLLVRLKERRLSAEYVYFLACGWPVTIIYLSHQRRLVVIILLVMERVCW